MRKVLSVSMLVLALVLVTILPSMAGSTTKSLATNFTLVNLGDGPANGIISYVKPDGTAWKADQSFQILTSGGYAAFKQYFDNDLPAGVGSAVVSSDQPLGAVVQIQARQPQVPSYGAYNGLNQGAETQYVPLVIRQLITASGLTNSQVIVQNTGQAPVNATITIVNGSGGTQYTKNVPNLAASASFTYDLADENGANIPSGFIGSAVVSAPGGSVAVISNMFMGPNGLMTFNAFSAPGTSWIVPLFISRLAANNLSTPIAIQNLSGGSLAAGAIQVTCNKNPNSAGQATFTVSNPQPVGNTASYNVNPVTDSVNLPTDWYGACTITSTGPVVAFVQMRYVGGDKAAAYEAIKGGGTDKRVMVPLAAKRMSNQFATVTDLVNLSPTSDAHVNFTYIPAPDYVTGGGSATNITVNNVTVPAGGMIQHNLRLASGAAAVPSIPDGWYGSVVIQSSDQPINAIVELTFLTGAGDTYQAHNAFTKP